jgi:hypothetical protein
MLPSPGSARPRARWRAGRITALRKPPTLGPDCWTTTAAMVAGSVRPDGGVPEQAGKGWRARVVAARTSLAAGGTTPGSVGVDRVCDIVIGRWLEQLVRRLGPRQRGPGGVESDVAFGDPMLGEPEVVRGDDLLAFAGIEPAVMRLYPVETHLAEKLHAYTLPRPTPSTRVKDLPDLVLLRQVGERDAALVRAAIEQTFAYRGTHPIPARLPDPPASWEMSYAEMAQEDSLPWPTLRAVTHVARAFMGEGSGRRSQ